MLISTELRRLKHMMPKQCLDTNMQNINRNVISNSCYLRNHLKISQAYKSYCYNACCQVLVTKDPLKE